MSASHSTCPIIQSSLILNESYCIFRRRTLSERRVLVEGGEVCEEDGMGAPRVGHLQVERLVGLLVPVGQSQSHVERRRTQHEQVVASHLLAVLTTVHRQTDIARAATQST